MGLLAYSGPALLWLRVERGDRYDVNPTNKPVMTKLAKNDAREHRMHGRADR